MPVELTSRFHGKVGDREPALAMAGGLAGFADGVEPASLTAPKHAGLRSYPMTPPRVYQGKNLEAVGMPLGGIGTGSLWLDGYGRLSVWQIFQ